MSNQEIVVNVEDSYKVNDFKPYMKNLFYRLDGMTNFYFVCDDNKNPKNLSQTALATIFNALYARENQNNILILENEAKNAEEKAQKASAELTSRSEELSSAQRNLSTLTARCEAFKRLSTSFEAIKGELVNGDGLVGEDGQPVGSKGLIEFVQFLKDFYDEHGEVLNFLDYEPDFKNALDSISTLMQESTSLDEFAKKWEGDAGHDGIKDHLARMYNCAWGDNGGLKQAVDELNDPTSDRYSNTLFYLATHEMEEDFCTEEDAVLVEGEDKKKGPPLLTEDDIQFSNQDIRDLGHATEYSIFGLNFMGDCLCALTDTDKEAVLTSGGASKNKDGKWEYDEQTFETPDAIFSIRGGDDPDQKFAIHFFDEAITQEVFVKDENYEKIREIVLSALVNEYSYKFTDKGIVNTLRLRLIDQLGKLERGYLDYRMQMCKSMLVDLQTQAKIVERYFYSNDTTGQRPNNTPDVGGFSKNTNWDGLKVLLDMHSDPKKFFGESVPNWDDSQSVDKNVEVAKNSLEKEIKEASASVEECTISYSMARAIADEDWLKYNTATKGNPNDLLNLALRYNTASGVGHKVRAIQREVDGTYSIQIEDPVTNPDSSDVTAKGALENMALPYYVLAVCLEKALAIKDIMTIQMQEVESINEEIKTNNEYLRQANRVYEEYYNCCVEDGTSRDQTYDSGNQALDDYVTHVCGYEFSSKGLHYRVYNTEGGTNTGGSYHYNNVDVVEQGNLTKLSSAQEAIRMYGDTRSTKSQMEVTELQQSIQNYNTCITICSQLARSIMEPYKGIANNTRY